LREATPWPSTPSSLVSEILLRRIEVKFNLVTACRALNILLEPSSQAVQVEDVTTPQPLGLLNLLKANDAGVINPRRQVLWSIHVRQALEFVDQRPGLEEELE